MVNDSPYIKSKYIKSAFTDVDKEAISKGTKGMKISDWNLSDWEKAGQMRALITDIQSLCRECCRQMSVGPQILAWLCTPMGKSYFVAIIWRLIALWKVEYESESRINQITIGLEPFEELVRSCCFEGRDLGVNNKTFPSRLSVGRTIEFEEVATSGPILLGAEEVFLGENFLRPAEPMEFLAWLRKNRQAGILTSIHCACPGIGGGYMYAGVCGGGDRGLHEITPNGNTWPPTTVFLGVKRN